MAPARRSQVLAKLAPRLWAIARIEGEMAQPTSLQEIGKDALFELRPMADPEVRAVIDGYLTDWLTGGYFEGRSAVGRYRGAAITRLATAISRSPALAPSARMIAAPR